MTVFIGAFQHQDVFHRVVTILVASSIVITAVYILRVVGILLLGPIKKPEYNELTDARWYEKLSTITLVVAITGIGLAPLWLSNTILDSLKLIITQLASVIH
jgi:NADH-quinone oxidoreductase subunit M